MVMWLYGICVWDRMKNEEWRIKNGERGKRKDIQNDNLKRYLDVLNNMLFVK